MFSLIHGWHNNLPFNVIPADSAIGESRDSLSENRSHDEPSIQGGGAVTIGLIMLVVAVVCGVIAYLAPHP